MSDKAKASDFGNPWRDKLGPILARPFSSMHEPPGMREMQRHRARNPILQELWALFLDGFLSFDRMLVAAVVLLADQAERLQAEVVVRATTIPRGSWVTMPSGTTITPEIKPGDVVAGCPTCGRVIWYPVAGEPVTCECGLTTVITAEIKHPGDRARPDHVVDG